MTTSMYIVVSIGMALALAGLALALVQGRQQPGRPVLWVIALVALGIDVALHIVLSVGSVVSGGIEGAWIVIGSSAIAIVLITAVIAPRVAGWTLAASAALLPIVLLAADAIVADQATEQIPIDVMLAIYSSRAIIVGALLVISAGGRADSSKQAGSQTGSMTSEYAPGELTGTPEPKRR